MKRQAALLGLALFMLFGLFQTSSAQGRFFMTTEERVAMLKDSLSLSSAQVKKITVILQDADKQRQEIFSAAGDDREGMRDKMMELTEKTDAKIIKILTKDQTAKYEMMQKLRRERMGNRPG